MCRVAARATRFAPSIGARTTVFPARSAERKCRHGSLRDAMRAAYMSVLSWRRAHALRSGHLTVNDHAAVEPDRGTTNEDTQRLRAQLFTERARLVAALPIGEHRILLSDETETHLVETVEYLGR